MGLMAWATIEDHFECHAWDVGQEGLVARGSVSLIVGA